MRTLSATQASRRFSELLDAVERGESVTVTRGHRAVAEIGPARRRIGRDLRAALEGSVPPGDAFEEHVAGAVALLTSDGTDPWAVG